MYYTPHPHLKRQARKDLSAEAPHRGAKVDAQFLLIV